MKIKYHPEIDGLRAIAVVAVILYHAQITIFGHQPFKGGFIGVDIFFGYGDSNSYNEDSYKYKNGVIIENLGDMINNSLYTHRVYAGSCEICLFDTLVREGYTFRIKREIIDDNVLIPAN